MSVLIRTFQSLQRRLQRLAVLSTIGIAAFAVSVPSQASGSIPFMHPIRNTWLAGIVAKLASAPQTIVVSRITNRVRVDDRVCGSTYIDGVSSGFRIKPRSFKLLVSCEGMKSFSIYLTEGSEDNVWVVFGDRAGTPLECQARGLPEVCSVPVEFQYFTEERLNSGPKPPQKDWVP